MTLHYITLHYITLHYITGIHTCIHTYIYTDMFTQIHLYIHIHIYIYKECIHTYIHIYICIYTRLFIHLYEAYDTTAILGTCNHKVIIKAPTVASANLGGEDELALVVYRPQYHPQPWGQNCKAKQAPDIPLIKL